MVPREVEDNAYADVWGGGGGWGGGGVGVLFLKSTFCCFALANKALEILILTLWLSVSLVRCCLLDIAILDSLI